MNTTTTTDTSTAIDDLESRLMTEYRQLDIYNGGSMMITTKALLDLIRDLYRRLQELEERR